MRSLRNLLWESVWRILFCFRNFRQSGGTDIWNSGVLCVWMFVISQTAVIQRLKSPRTPSISWLWFHSPSMCEDSVLCIKMGYSLTPGNLKFSVGKNPRKLLPWRQRNVGLVSLLQLDIRVFSLCYLKKKKDINVIAKRK